MLIHQNVVLILVKDVMVVLKKEKKVFVIGLELEKMEEEKNVVLFLQFVNQIKKKIITCHNTHRKCGWTSKLVKTYKKSNCLWKNRTGGKQRNCCHWTVKCFGTKCYNLRKKCHWEGKLLTKTKTHGCKWVVVGKNTRRLRCCTQSKTCKGKRCVRKNRKCRFTSLPISINWITKCKWKKTRNTRVKRCCRHLRKCIGKKCRKSKRTCKNVDKVTKKKKTIM